MFPSVNAVWLLPAPSFVEKWSDRTKRISPFSIFVKHRSIREESLMPPNPIQTCFRLFTRPAWSLLCLLLCLGARQTGVQPPRVEKPLVITHVSVVDVRAGRLLPDQSVVISGERILSVKPSGKAKVPNGARIVSGKGLFLLPGLFDSHVHLNSPEQDARMLIANGVTFVRDMGERMGQRAQARQGKFLGLEMAAVGTILDGNPPYHAWSRACATPEEGRAAVGEMARAGVDGRR